MLSEGLFRGATKEQVVYILEEGARAEQASGQVPGQNQPEVVGTVSEPLREYGPCELCSQLGVGVSPGENKEELAVRVEWDGIKGMLEVNNGEMRGFARYGRKEGVGVRDKWMGRDHCRVDQEEILHQPIVS